MRREHPAITAVSKHRGPIVASIPLINSILYVKLVKSDLIHEMRRDPAMCDEMSILVTKESRTMYVDRGFGQVKVK